VPPAIGRISDRHAAQTGRREMLTKGVPQRRQSEGKRVANRLSTRPLTEEATMDTSEPSRGSTLLPVARIGSPLLLKTNLPRPPGATRSASGRILFSIAGRIVPSNETTSRLLRDVPIWIRAVLAPGRKSSAPIAGSNCRSVPGGEAVRATGTFQQESSGANGIR
jgi:hypothetical protein